MLFVEKKNKTVTEKRLGWKGTLGLRGECSNAPTRCRRIRDIVGGGQGGQIFPTIFPGYLKDTHPPPQCFMNKRWKFKAATRNWYPIFCDVLVKFLFFRIPFVRNWRGAKMMRYVRVSGFRHSKDRFSQLHRNCKAPKTPGAFYHWLKIISYSK